MSRLIATLMEEHQEILRFVEELKEMCRNLMEDGVFEEAKFREGILFIREFADKAHHQKEEQILFRAMMENLGAVAEKLVKGGMLVEHDLARLHVAELEKAVDAYSKNPTAENKLDIIGNAMGYCYLLKRHAQKEDQVVYPFARRSLSADILQKLDEEAERYGENMSIGI